MSVCPELTVEDFPELGQCLGNAMSFVESFKYCTVLGLCAGSAILSEEGFKNVAILGLYLVNTISFIKG